MNRQGEAGKHREIGVKLHTLQAAHAQGAESVFVLQAAELALDSGAAAIEVAEPLRVSRDVREQSPARRNRQYDLLALHAFKRDDGEYVAGGAFLMHPHVVVPLAGLGADAASAERVKQGRNEQRLVVARGARLPRERESRPGAYGEVDLVAVEAAALARADGGAVSPRCVRVGELLAELASVADVAHPVRVGRE